MKHTSTILFNSLAFFLFMMLLIVSPLNSQTFSVVAGSGAGSPTSANVIGVYVYSGTYPPDNKAYYTKISGNGNPSYCFYINGFWDISAVLGDDGPTNLYYYNFAGVASEGSTFPVGDYGLTWSADYGQVTGTNAPVTSQNTTANMTFTNSSSYTPPPVPPGTNNNPIGRFQLMGSSVGGVLQAVTISLSGTRSGITAVKLWRSTDNSFSSGTDKLLSSKSDGSSVTFNVFNSLVDNSSGTYYFITVDLTGGATGNVTATIPDQASFSFAGANPPSGFTNAALTSGTTLLPVELTSFIASVNKNSVALNWSTATEINNFGFEIERREIHKSEWLKVGFVAGNGTSSSTHSYSYTDAISSGTYAYRLKQIDNSGTYKYSSEAEVTTAAPKEFLLNQNYPNPFNPSTTIAFDIPEQTQVTLKIYDLLGKEVAVLINNEAFSTGSHTRQWTAVNISAGLYFYRLQAGSYTETKKLLLLK